MQEALFATPFAFPPEQVLHIRQLCEEYLPIHNYVD